MSTLQQAIDAFEDPKVLASVSRLIMSSRPDSTPMEVAIETGLYRVVYVCGVVAACRSLTGGEPDTMAEDLRQRIDDLYLLQLPAQEA